MNLISNIQKGLMQLAALAFVVGLIVAAPQSSSANTGAGATIVNVVTVNYQSPGNVALVASASATVTVTLVKKVVLLTAVGATTGSTASGTPISYTFTATSQANGRDVYLLNATLGTLTGATAPTVVFELTSNPGVAITNLTLASTVISDVTAADTLVFPAGTVVDLAANDIVVINTVDYLVQSVSGLGTAATANVSATTAGTIGAEIPVSVVLVANPAGSNVTPAFTPSIVGTPSPDIGTLVTEQQTFIAKVTSTTNQPGNGSVPVDITVGGPIATSPVTTPITTTTTVLGANLTITKEVSTDGGLTFAATGSGAPLSTLIYRTTVSNGGGGDASSVIISDPMPAYTSYTLLSASSAVVVGALPVGGLLPAAATGLTDAVDAIDNYDFGITTVNTATLTVPTVAAGSSVVLFYSVTIQ